MRDAIELLEGILPPTRREKAQKRLKKMRRFRKGERKKVSRDMRGGSAYKHPTPKEKDKGWRDEGWDEDLCLFMVAKLFESGDLDEGLIYTRDVAKEQGDPVGIFFKPPRYIRQISAEEFPDAEALWWQAVTELLKKGTAFDLSNPKKLKPLFKSVMSLWKDKVAEKYGYRPSRSKERGLQQEIDKNIRDAAKAMRASRSKEGVDREALSRAARAMRARRTARG